MQRLWALTLAFLVALVHSQSACNNFQTNYWTYPEEFSDVADGFYQYLPFNNQPTIALPGFDPSLTDGLSGSIVNFQWITNLTFCATNTQAGSMGQVLAQIFHLNIAFRTPDRRKNVSFVGDVELRTPLLLTQQSACQDPTTSQPNPQGVFQIALNASETLQFFTNSPVQFFTSGRFSNEITSGSNFISTASVSVYVNCSLIPLYNKLKLNKTTEFVHYDAPTGYPVLAGRTVHWQYRVTNSGTALISSVGILDNRGVPAVCPTVALRPCESFVCNASGIAQVGQYVNTAVAYGRGNISVLGTDLTFSNNDTSYYFGNQPKVALLKYTNDVNIRTTSQPIVVAGSIVTWKYEVTNTGNCDLVNVTVTDNRPGVYPMCASSTLAVGAVATCSVTGVAISGQYTNIGTVRGYCPAAAVNSDIPSSYTAAVNDSSYFGITQSISILSYTNGVDIHRFPRPFVKFQGPVTWAYEVTNTGNSVLTNVFVTDSVYTGTITCPTPATLAPAGTFTCSAVSSATTLGLYDNTGSAFGTSPASIQVNARNSTGYFGVDQRISIKKLTNNVDHLTTPGNSGPIVGVGTTVTWQYLVTNTGNVQLSSVTVTDDHSTVVVRCPTAVALAAGSVRTCTATGTAVVGAYTNVGSVSGVSPLAPPTGPNTLPEATVTAISPSAYFGVDQRISIRTYTNDVDTPLSGPPNILRNDPVTWKYAVTNTGNSVLTSVMVYDTVVGLISCPTMPDPLGIGSIWTCSALAATGAIGQGTYNNIGSAVGVSPLGPVTGVVTAVYPTAYFGVTQQISLIKYTQGIDTVNFAPPFVLAGGPVQWKYAVTNQGNTALTSISVTDNIVGPISCGFTSLNMGATQTCTAIGVAVVGSYTNVGSVIGFSTALPANSVAHNAVSATYPSQYFGGTQGVSITKYTNGNLAASPPSLYLLSPVTWTYAVTNTGNTLLTAVVVSDNKLTPGSVVCPSGVLSAASTFTCVATGLAGATAYTNVGSVRGVSPLPTPNVVSSTSPGAYTGLQPVISIFKFTNGVAFNGGGSPPRPNILVGTVVTWTYAVTNPNDADLTSVAVTDNQFPSRPASCPSNFLAAHATFTCTATGTAVANTYNNVGSAFGCLGAACVTSTAPSGYLGINPSVSIVKTTNTVNTVATGNQPNVLSGSVVTWRYTVTNTGNVVLTNLVVSDDQGVIPVCPTGQLTSLGVAAIMTCTATGAAISGQYNNVGSVIGFPPLPQPVSSSFPSRYFGVTPVISLSKTTNDVHVADADHAVGAEAGSQVVWKYEVTNTGNFGLSGVAVTDDKQGPILCPGLPNPLGAGSIFVCSATAIVQSSSMLYHNTATAVGAALGVTVSATDQSWYNPVVNAKIQIIKRTNGVYTVTDEVPRLRVGDPVTWTYEVTNTGTVVLTSVVVTDDVQTNVVCPSVSQLNSMQTITCTATGTVIDCMYNNIGSVRASRGVSDFSPSAYIGIVPIISLQKFTNNFNHYELSSGNVNPRYPPFLGPCVPTGSRVTWHYVVSNIGDDLLTNVVVDDDQLGPLPVCTIESIAPWYSFTCVATGDAVDGQYHNIATARGTPTVGMGDVISVDQNWHIGLNPLLQVSIAINGQQYYDPLCDICGIGEEEGSMASASSGKSGKQKGQAFGTAGDQDAVVTRKAQKVGVVPALIPLADNELGQAAVAEAAERRRSPQQNKVAVLSGKGEGEGESGSSGSSGSGKKSHLGHHHHNNCTLFYPRNRLLGEAMSYSSGEGKEGKGKGKALAAEPAETRRRVGALDAQPQAVTGADKPVNAKKDVLSGGGSEGEGDSYVMVTPEEPPANCLVTPVPHIYAGNPVSFSITVRNSGSEWLSNVYLQLDDLCLSRQIYTQVSVSSEGEGKSVHTKAVETATMAVDATPEMGEAEEEAEASPAPLATAGMTETDKIAMARREVLLSTGGKSGKNKKAKAGTKTMRPTEEGLGEGVRTNRIVCPTNLLGPGMSMVCNLTHTTIQTYGMQQLSVKAQGFGTCTGICTTSWSAAQWYTPLPPRPPTLPTAPSVQSGKKGKKSSNPTFGCSATFWRSASGVAHYPAGITPDTQFTAVFGGSSDPTAGLTLSSVLWSLSTTPQAAFFRSFTAAILNGNAIASFGIPVETTQAAMFSAWTSYQLTNQVSYLTNAARVVDSWAQSCPFS